LSASELNLRRRTAIFQVVSWYQNVSLLDFIGAKGDVGGGNNWSYKTCKTLVKLSPPTNQHPVFFTGQMSFQQPTNQPTVSKHWRDFFTDEQYSQKKITETAFL